MLIWLIILLVGTWLLFKSKPPLRPNHSVEDTPSSEIFFEEDDPRDWDDYHGQERAKRFIQLQIDTLPPDRGLKILLIAPKGAGKTTLFRIIGSKLQRRGGRYLEYTPATLRNKRQVDELMYSLGPQDILCLDEIHLFSRYMADVLLPAIEDNIYPFDDGMKRLPPGISWIGATTDAGLLPPAFNDRFNTVALERLTVQNMKDVLHDLPYEIAPYAATELAKRSLGSPRELKRVYGVAKNVAINCGSTVITEEHMREAFNILDLDPNGLYAYDRQILEALYNNPKYYAPRRDGTRPKRFAHSERALRALTGLDEALYKDRIEPKLLQTGFITISSGGRELTPKAIKTYFNPE